MATNTTTTTTTNAGATNTPAAEDIKLKQVMDKLETEGMKKTAVLLNQSSGAGGSVQEAVLSILQSGGDEFEKQMGRKMTYGEMREMYG
jgi:hypothetical protein